MAATEVNEQAIEQENPSQWASAQVTVKQSLGDYGSLSTATAAGETVLHGNPPSAAQKLESPSGCWRHLDQREFVKEGDVIWSSPDNKWRPVALEDIGRLAWGYWCVLRMVPNDN